MPRRGKESKSEPSRRRPATTPEARENQVIAKAFDLAERQIEEGNASAQVISHFLKLGSSREKLEQERLRHENEFLVVKKEMMESAKRVEEMYTSALNAMRSYAGQDPMEFDHDEEY